MDHETFVGVVHDLSNDAKLTLTILHPKNRTVAQSSWSIETDSYNPFEKADGGLRLKGEPGAYFDAFVGIREFLELHCGVSTRILIEYPSGEITMDSAFSRLMAFLIAHGFGACIIDFDDSAIIHFRAIPQEQRPATVSDDLIFLGNGKAKAYAMVLCDAEACTDSQYGSAAALIAMNPHLHRYLKSRGVVFSSQDIALFLQDPTMNNPLVISGDTVYFLSMIEPSGLRDLEDMHLEYATALNRFNFLPPGEALKFSVLCVCKQMGLRLHCLSADDPRADALLDEEVLGPDEYVAYDPSQPVPAWIWQTSVDLVRE